MGLLDDAIREHLDLKRRRGADPADVERLEREALGPVRREFDQPPPAPEGAGEAVWREGPAEREWEDQPGPALEESLEPHDPGSARTELHPAHPEFLEDDDEIDERGPRPLSFQPRSLRDRFRRGSRRQADSDPEEMYGDDDLEAYDDDPFAEPVEHEPYRAPEAHEPYAAPEAEDPYAAPRAEDPYAAPRAEDPYAAPHADDPYAAPRGEDPYGAPQGPEPPSAPARDPERPASGGDPRDHAGQETVEYDALADGPDFEESVRRVPRALSPPQPPPREPAPAAGEPHGTPAPEPAAAPDEDMLEETPDFLHDTPEHDRLWFEQRPPRDFDFNE